MDIKGTLSTAHYVPAVAVAFLAPIVSDIILATIAVMWFVPDRRFEALIDQHERTRRTSRRGAP